MRIGIFGGTFNPPHMGHLALASVAKMRAELDRVIFIPCARPPHKPDADIPSGEHRFNMVKLLLGNFDGFEISDIEILAEGKSYTARTLESLEKIYPNDVLCLIVGADSLMDMEKWFCPDEIFKRAEIVVAHRGGMKEAELNMAIDFFKQKYGARIRKVEMKPIEMSSSDIRRRIESGESVKNMLSDEVIDYIEKNALYKERI